MGSSCSSGQAHKDKDSVSTHSEDYQVSGTKGRQETTAGGGNDSGEGRLEKDGVSSSSSLVTTSIIKKNDTGPGPLSPPTPSTPSTATAGPLSCEPKPSREGFFHATKDGTPSSLSGKGGDVPGTMQLPIPPELHHLPSTLLMLLSGRALGAPVVCTPGAVSGAGGQIGPVLGANTAVTTTGSSGLLRSPDRCSKISIYVCAADSQDCCVEKGVLHKIVYPKLREHCRDFGFEVHIVDLHWKTALEKQQDHEFPELCLGELSRQMEVAFVIPVLFLSHSLGTPLLPKTIENQDFKTAVGRAVDPGDRDLLQKWYKLDSHAQPPCYRLQPIASHIPGFKEDSSEEKEKALREWRSEIERTLAVMVNVFPQELRDTYLTTVVEQEVHNTVFMSQELAKRCIWLCRVISNVGSLDSSSSERDENVIGSNGSSPSSSHGDMELKRRLKILQSDLRSQLSEKHILRLPVEGYKLDDERREEGTVSSNGSISPSILVDNPSYVEEVTDRLWHHLKEISEAIIEESQVKNAPKPTYGIENNFFQELDQQATFCQQAAQCSVNRNSLLQEIKNYVTGDKCNLPMVVHGPTGCGKTTLLARTAQSCLSWSPDGFVVARFVGATAESVTIEQILRSLTQQCFLIAYGHPNHFTHNLDEYSKMLPKILSEASASQKKIIIIIDGIDQVKNTSPCPGSWLPLELPEHVKIIISVDNESIWFSELKKRLHESTPFIEVLPLEKEEAQTILMASVMQYNHIVNNHLQDCVRSSVQECTLPLYVKILAWQTSWWPDKEHEITPRGNIKDQINNFLDELENFLGKKRVQHAFALTAASRFGLTDSEMLDLLAHDEAFHSETTYVPWAPACLFWAQLNKFLRPLVRWVQVGGYGLTQWRDFSFTIAIKERYLGSETSKDSEFSAHPILADYFSGKWVEENLSEMTGRLITQPIKTENCYNRRKLDELPYQVFCIEGSLKDQFLFDKTWLFYKICGSDVYQVIEDILMEKDWADNGDLCLLKKWLEESATALNYDGCQFYTQAYIRLQKILENANEGGSGDQEYPFIQSLLKASLDPPVPSLIPGIPDEVEDINKYLMSLVESDREDEEDSASAEKHSLDFLCRLPPGSSLVATASASREEICVWKVGGGKNDQNNRLRGPRKLCCLQGVSHPVALKPVDGGRVVALCRRELRLYDLENGCLLSRLKGVMNQKMPYYGLHGQGYVAALSRNRMHVNLLEVTTGDCVATFKAGEDRFLDSLLVSGDGRILVCGDETQKPFPLLVWDLASRKLLYDLRIPRHDFVTRLAGITYEGHYVCCVCKEVDEPSPNFIVVYDLQSGTLFKKWKPGVDTVSIDISSPVGCVLSGLEDSRILVWDLITGNCRWRLSGHTAPVTVLRLDPSGTCFISADSEGRDRSLRLWDLQEGKLMAVYTPKKKATAWEVMDRGKTIVLAFKDSVVISVLHLEGSGREDGTLQDEEFFNWDSGECRVFNVASEEGIVSCGSR